MAALARMGQRAAHGLVGTAPAASVVQRQFLASTAVAYPRFGHHYTLEPSHFGVTGHEARVLFVSEGELSEPAHAAWGPQLRGHKVAAEAEGHLRVYIGKEPKMDDLRAAACRAVGHLRAVKASPQQQKLYGYGQDNKKGQDDGVEKGGGWGRGDGRVSRRLARQTWRKGHWW